MLCCVAYCCAVLCCVILCCVVLCCVVVLCVVVVSYCAFWCVVVCIVISVELCHIVLGSVVSFCVALPCCLVLCCHCQRRVCCGAGTLRGDRQRTDGRVLQRGLQGRYTCGAVGGGRGPLGGCAQVMEAGRACEQRVIAGTSGTATHPYMDGCKRTCKQADGQPEQRTADQNNPVIPAVCCSAAGGVVTA